MLANDALRYDEPPAWMIPARHVLGAALMKVGKAAQAEQVYRADLAKLPDNGWSLFGLPGAASPKQDRRSRALPGEVRKGVGQGDIQIKSSCIVPGRRGDCPVTRPGRTRK